MVKLTPNVTDIAVPAKAAEDAGADSVSLVNTFRAMAIDPRTRTFRIANRIGGLSGPAIRPIAVRMVWEVAQAVKIPVVGLGGIDSADAAFEFILAGATAVQVGTWNFVEPGGLARIAADFEAILAREGVARYSELIGAVRDA